MAAIREVLTLEDRFTTAFSQYIRLSESASASTSDAQKAAQRLTQESKILASAYNTAAAKSKAEKAAIEQATAAQKKAEQQARATGNATKKMGSSFQSAKNEANNLISVLSRLVTGYLGLQSIKGIFNISDQMAGAKSRLEMLADNEQGLKDLRTQVMDVANRSRANFFDISDMVVSLGFNAGSAFNNNNELLRFTEILSKQFSIYKVSAEGQTAAMRQLAQGMASGALRGDELVTVMEQIPSIGRAIEKYLGIAEGSIRNYASENEISAEIVKNALFMIEDETNNTFDKTTKTWGDTWTRIKNSALESFQPILDKISEFANSDDLQEFTDSLADGMETLAGIVKTLGENLDVLGPIASGTATFLGILTIAQWGLNTAMNANPVLLIITLFLSLLVTVMMLWDTNEGFRESVISTYSEIGRKLSEFYNNVVVPVGNGWFNFLNDAKDGTYNFLTSVSNAFFDLAENIISALQPIFDIYRELETKYNSAADHFNLPKLDITDSLLPTVEDIEKLRSERLAAYDLIYNVAADKMGWVGRNPLEPIEDIEQSINNFEEGAEDFRFTGLISDFFKSVSDGSEELIKTIMEAATQGADPFKNEPHYDPYNGIGSNVEDSISSALGQIGRDTSAIRKEVSMAEEDIKMLVDMAEREYVANVNLTAQSPVITVNATSNDGSAIQPKAIANAIKNILIDESSSHTVRTYSMI